MCYTPQSLQVLGRHLSHIFVMQSEVLSHNHSSQDVSIPFQGTWGRTGSGRWAEGRFWVFSVSEEGHSKLPGQLYSQILLQLLPSPILGVCPKLSFLHKAFPSLHKKLLSYYLMGWIFIQLNFSLHPLDYKLHEIKELVLSLLYSPAFSEYLLYSKIFIYWINEWCHILLTA